MFYVDTDTTTIDRYEFSKFMEFTDDGVFDPFSSYMLLQIPKLQCVGKYKIKREEYRPDLLAWSIYGDTQYWWVLLWYNALTSPLELTMGLEISYPSLTALENLYTNAALLQKTT